MRKTLMIALWLLFVSIPTYVFAAPPEPQEGVAVQNSQTGARLGCATRGSPLPPALVEVWAATEGPNWYYTRPVGSQVKAVLTPRSAITSPINENNCTQDGVPQPAPTVKVEVGDLLGCAIQKAGNGHIDRWVRVWEAKGKPERFYALPTNYSLYPNAPLEELGKDDLLSQPNPDGCPPVNPTTTENKRLSPAVNTPTVPMNASVPAADVLAQANAANPTSVHDSFHLALPDGEIWMFFAADICLAMLILFLVGLLAVANTVQMLQKKQPITVVSWTKELLRMFHILPTPQAAVTAQPISRPTTVEHPSFRVISPAPAPTAVVARVPSQHPLPPAQATSVAPPLNPVPPAPPNGSQEAAPVGIPPVPTAPGQVAPAEGPNPDLVPIAPAVAVLNGRPLTEALCQRLAETATMADLLTSVFEDGDIVSAKTLAAVFADCHLNPEQVLDLQGYLVDRGYLNGDAFTVTESTYNLLTREEDAEVGKVEEPLAVEADDEVEGVALYQEDDVEPVIPFLTAEEEAQVPQDVLDVFYRNWALFAYLLRAGYPTRVAKMPIDFDGGSKRTRGKPNTPPWTVDEEHITGSFSQNSGGRVTTPEMAQAVIDLLKRSGVIDSFNKVTLPAWKSIYLFLEQIDLFHNPPQKYGYLALSAEQRALLFPEPELTTAVSTPASETAAPPGLDEEDFLDVVEDN